MAIRHWDAGKLALVWLVCALPAWFLFKDATRARWYVTPPVWFSDEMKQAQFAKYRYEAQVAQFEFIAALVLVAIAIVVSWRWFSGRERRPTTQ